MAAADGWIRTRRDGSELVCDCGGDWLVGAAAALDRTVRSLDPGTARRIVLDLGSIAALDTAGALLLVRAGRHLAVDGRSVRFANVAADVDPLLRQVAALVERPYPALPSARYRFGDEMGRLGGATVAAARHGVELVGFLGLVSAVALGALRRPGRLRLTALLAHVEQTGLDALPIVGLLSALIGIVVAFQGAGELRRFGAEIYTVNLLGVSILREMGGLLAAIILAGRSGSAFTAQLGAMTVNEEIDAMRVIGLDPVEVLVLPRLFGMLVTLPLVTFYANVMGLFGGALMSWSALGISPAAFLRQLHGAAVGWTPWLGLLKAPIFAVIIALTGCYEGLRVARNAESVGRQTTRSVVESIFLIILADAAFSIVFTDLGI